MRDQSSGLTEIVRTTRARLGTGVAWSLLGSLFNQGSTLVVNIGVARILGRQAFGEFALVQATLVTFSTVFQLAIGFTATRFIAEYRSVDKERVGRIVGFCVVMSGATALVGSLLLVAGSGWLAAEVLRSSALKPILMIAGLAVALNILNGLQAGILAGLESYRALARTGVIAGCTYVVVCILATFEWGLPGSVLGIGLSAVVQAGVLWREIRREQRLRGIKVSFRNLRNERGLLSRFALPAAASGISAMPAIWCVNALLVRKGGGYSQLALFGAANNLRTLILFFPALVNSVGLSLLSNELRSGELGGYRRLFQDVLWLTALLAGVGAVVILVGGPALLLAFGRDFRDAYPVLRPLVLAAILEAVAVGVAQIVQTQGNMWKILFGVALPRDTVLVGLAALWVAPLGAQGLAWAFVIAWLVALASLAWMTRRSLIRIEGR